MTGSYSTSLHWGFICFNLMQIETLLPSGANPSRWKNNIKFKLISNIHNFFR